MSDLVRHAVAVSTVRRFAAGSGAVRVVVLIDRGDGATATMLEWEPGGTVAVTADGATALVAAGELEDVAPLPLDPPRAVPGSAIEIHPEEGRIDAPLGAVANLAMGVLDLARALGGRSVATADFDTRSGVVLTIAARDGEPLVLAVEDHQFELPPEL